MAFARSEEEKLSLLLLGADAEDSASTGAAALAEAAWLAPTGSTLTALRLASACACARFGSMSLCMVCQ